MSFELRQSVPLDMVVSPYGPYERPVVKCGEGMTRQSMQDECDINRIVARYEKTGMITHVVRESGVFADVSDVGDYREAIERVRRADEFFMRLPPLVRLEFGNDPAAFLDYVSKPENRADLESRGILEKAPAPPGASAPAAVVPETP